MLDDKLMISFIIPVYNAQNTIKKCVDSILAIEYENIEVIVVDDGSTDKTAEILKSFDTDRIIVIYQENKGVSAARNLGINNAKGKYISFVDADDYIISGEFAKFLKDVQQDRDFYMYAYESREKDQIRKITLPVAPGIYGHDMAEKMGDRLYDCPFSRNYKSDYFGGKVYQYLFLTDFLKKNHILFLEDVHYTEDTLFCLTCFKYTKKFEVKDTCLYVYEVLEDSASHRFREEFWDEMIMAYDRACLIMNREIGHRNELYFHFGNYNIHCIVKRFSGISAYFECRRRIKKMVYNTLFHTAILHMEFTDWTRKEKIMIFLYRYRLVPCIYWLYQLRNVRKRMPGG